MLDYKCRTANLGLIKLTEAYTSKCSFLDQEEIRKHEEYKGRRMKRGLFKSAVGLLLNADLNGSLNILSKHLGKNFVFDRVEDFVVSPYKINIAC